MRAARPQAQFPSAAFPSIDSQGKLALRPSRAGLTAMIEKVFRTEAHQQAAERRDRAARYETLAAEAQQRGDIQLSIEFASKAAEELVEASRIEEGKPG
jgi:hypothetical protein